MDILKRIRGLPVQFGGEEHSGWLPPGAATPLPTPTHGHTLDLEICGDGGSGFLLCYQSRDGKISADSWHATIKDAETAAAEMFGIDPADWS